VGKSSNISLLAQRSIKKKVRAIVRRPFLHSLILCLQNSSGTFSASLKQVSTLRYSLFQSWVSHKRLGIQKQISDGELGTKIKKGIMKNGEGGE
jgi:hypothetical protein